MRVSSPMLATEGEQRVFKGDKRIMKLVQQVSSDFHRECATVDMPYVTTDAHVAMGMSLRSLTIGGVEAPASPSPTTEEDQPYNVDTDNVARVRCGHRGHPPLVKAVHML